MHRVRCEMGELPGPRRPIALSALVAQRPPTAAAVARAAAVDTRIMERRHSRHHTHGTKRDISSFYFFWSRPGIVGIINKIIINKINDTNYLDSGQPRLDRAGVNN